MKKTFPLIKGLITGALMIGISLLPSVLGESVVQYSFYLIYAAGITWTLLDYYRSANYIPQFGNIFNQGFRCFIIVTLIYVIFVGTYAATHPEIAEKAAVEYRAEMKALGNKSNKTPQQVEEDVKNIKNQFVTGSISIAVFRSLIIGSIFTAAGSGILLLSRK